MRFFHENRFPEICLFVFAVLLFACQTKVKVKDSCNDGFLDPGEDCEDGNLNGNTCGSLGFHIVDNPLSCKKCRFDTSLCGPRCGDGVINPEYEDCEGLRLDGATCESLGFLGGQLRCSAECRFDVNSCLTDCGNGIMEGNEQCDDGNSGSGDGCSSLCRIEDGYECSGTPSVCRTVCGDGMVAGNEQCDGDNLSGQGCHSLGYFYGILECTDLCAFWESECVGLVSLASSYHQCGVDRDGHAWCWGHNEDGKLGDGTEALRTRPTSVSLPVGVQLNRIVTGRWTTCATETSGGAWCWGSNRYSGLGSGVSDNSFETVPRRVVIPDNH